MQVEFLGGDEPEVAIVGGIHGDEPCGVRAVETLMAERPAVERPVALVIANEAACEVGERYLETDLNRAFPGDADGDTHEERLAARIHDLLGDCLTLSLHSTQSYEGLFSLVDEVDNLARRICPHLSVDAVVDVGAYDRGRLFEAVPRTIEVECGYQGSETATENAKRVSREFLGAVGALPEERRPARTDLPLFRLSRPIQKDGADTYEVYASNFEAVEAGQPYAAMDARDVVAEEGFYPVLMSPYGYENLFGYAAERAGVIQPLESDNS